MALLLCTLFIALTLVVLSTLSLRIVAQAHHGMWAEKEAQVFAAAEAALALSASSMTSLGFTGAPAYDTAGRSVPPGFGAPGVTPQTFAAMPGMEYFAVAAAWGSDGLDNNGDGAADDAGEQGVHAVLAFARSGALARGIEAVFREQAAGGALAQVSWREIPVAPGTEEGTTGTAETE
ncbi:MAG: hypothetical protein HYV26_08530 [Candidatus Hydrogenedentes bacterium]|nr:hypothetical protein [Candidatus Hydrogenedentota bacterium]